MSCVFLALIISARLTNQLLDLSFCTTQSVVSPRLAFHAGAKESTFSKFKASVGRSDSTVPLICCSCHAGLTTLLCCLHNSLKRQPRKHCHNIMVGKALAEALGAALRAIASWANKSFKFKAYYLRAGPKFTPNQR